MHSFWVAWVKMYNCRLLSVNECNTFDYLTSDWNFMVQGTSMKGCLCRNMWREKIRGKCENQSGNPWFMFRLWSSFRVNLISHLYMNFFVDICWRMHPFTLSPDITRIQPLVKLPTFSFRCFWDSTTLVDARKYSYFRLHSRPKVPRLLTSNLSQSRREGRLS